MSSRPSTLDRERTLLAVIDVQEGFRPVVRDFDAVAKNIGVLVQAANILKAPVLVSEQYPKGLGRTSGEVAEHLGDVEVVDKACFSALGAVRFEQLLAQSGRDQVLLSGIESHVCVSQTAHDLLERGFTVHVACDAVSSRSDQNLRLGLRKMEQAGAVLTSVETALFELLKSADADEFKRIQGLIK